MSVPACWEEPMRLEEVELGRPAASLLRRTDGEALLYRDRVNELHGEPEAGKGYIIGAAVGELILKGTAVLYLDFDQDPVGVLERIKAAGVPPERLREHLYLHCISEPLPLRRVDGVRAWTEAAAGCLDRLAATPGLAMTVLDGVNAAMSMLGLEPNSAADCADFMRLLVFPFRSAAGVLLADHTVKDPERRGRFALGSIQKSAALDGASFSVRVLEQPAPGKVGRLRLVVAKDRPGAVRAISRRVAGEDVAADVEINGTVDPPNVRIDPPGDASAFAPTYLMERVSRLLEASDEALSLRAIRDGVQGKGAYVDQAVRALVERGHLVREHGPRGAVLHRLARPFREAGSD